MSIEFTAIAYEEYKDAVEYYNIQETGIGERFKEDVDQSLQRIEKYPEAWQHETISTRRFLLKRFPYKIIYYIENNRIIVIALAHTHRKPFYWVDRFSGKADK